MKTILAAVDFSDAAGKVVSSTADLAADLGAQVVFLHVIEPVANYVPVGAAMDVIETAPPPIFEQDIEAQRAKLDDLTKECAADGISIENEVVIGLAADEIIENARSAHADLIVLGSHGHGALYHLFSGSVVTGVLKRSHVPVVVIPVGERLEKRSGLRRARQ